MLADAGEQLSRLRATVGADIESRNEARPWGGDELGAAFARRYGEAAAQVLDVWRSLGERTGQLGGDIAGAAGAALETDRITSEVIDNVG